VEKVAASHATSSSPLLIIAIFVKFPATGSRWLAFSLIPEKLEFLSKIAKLV